MITKAQLARRRAIIAAYRKDRRSERVAARFGITHQRVSQIIHAYAPALLAERDEFGRVDPAAVARLARRGRSIAAIARQLGISEYTAKRAFHALGFERLRKWTPERVTGDLLALAATLRRAPRVKEVPTPLRAAAQRLFGNVTLAKHAAGLPRTDRGTAKRRPRGMTQRMVNRLLRANPRLTLAQLAEATGVGQTAVARLRTLWRARQRKRGAG